jgi:putative SOS response-associated peptidase YedK
MCGRYTLTEVDPHKIAARFGEFDEHGIDPDTLGRFNVCPTETIVTVDSEGPRAVRWGLVPSYAKKLNQGPMLINARMETVATKSPFARLIERPERRCLVLADGWYEWLKPENPKGEKIPFRYTIDGGAPFAFAGLWGWAKIDEEWIASATILTTTANGVSRPVHDRMPCVLASPEAEAAWLSPDVDVPAALEFLTPLADERTSVAPANPAVNKAGVEGPELIVAPQEGGGDSGPDQLTLV